MASAQERQAKDSPQGTPEDFDRLRVQTDAAAERIIGLAQEETTPIDDLHLARSVAQKLKPYIDRVSALKRLLNPVHRIVENRTHVNELQAAIAEDVAHVEALSNAGSDEIDPPLLTDLKTEVAAIKRDRKLFVREVDAEDEKRSESGKQQRAGMLDLPIHERLERIFKDRYVGPGRLSELVGLTSGAEELEQIYRPLADLWATLMETEELRPHVERNRIKTLQNTFADYALILRLASVPGQRGADAQVPCNLHYLRHTFEPFFSAASERSLWYAGCDFYKAGIGQTHWALVDRQYLNCTFKKPGIRLLMYARANDLPTAQVGQKSVVEDIYDRVMLSLSTGERFFEDCNSMTRTSYRQGGKGSTKQVFVYEKDGTLRISGKKGSPHWRPGRPHWPGILPAVVFS